MNTNKIQKKESKWTSYLWLIILPIFAMQSGCTSGLEPETANVDETVNTMSTLPELTPEEKSIYQSKLGKTLATFVPDNQLNGYDVGSGGGATCI